MKKRTITPVIAPKMSREALDRLDNAYDWLRKERAADYFSTLESTGYKKNSVTT